MENPVGMFGFAISEAAGNLPTLIILAGLQMGLICSSFRELQQDGNLKGLLCDVNDVWMGFL